MKYQFTAQISNKMTVEFDQVAATSKGIIFLPCAMKI
jgi:hypothetical protein